MVRLIKEDIQDKYKCPRCGEIALRPDNRDELKNFELFPAPGVHYTCNKCGSKFIVIVRDDSMNYIEISDVDDSDKDE